jgi:hypothetical protein
MSDEKDKLLKAAQKAQRVLIAKADLKAEVPLDTASPPEELEEEEIEEEEEGS